MKWLLETIESFVKDDEYLGRENRYKILKMLDEDFSADEYKYQVKEVKDLLEKHDV